MNRRSSCCSFFAALPQGRSTESCGSSTDITRSSSAAESTILFVPDYTINSGVVMTTSATLICASGTGIYFVISLWSAVLGKGADS